MNEQIQQLADKIWAEEYWDNPYTDKLLPAQLNKFAELIVRECCSAIRLDDAFNGGKFQRTILTHFGVEE
jgi:hypothetical protein